MAIATGDPTLVQAALSAADQKIVAQYGYASPNVSSPPSRGQATRSIVDIAPGLSRRLILQRMLTVTGNRSSLSHAL